MNLLAEINCKANYNFCFAIYNKFTLKFWHPGFKAKSVSEPEFQQYSIGREKNNYFRILAKKRDLFTAKISKGFY